MKYIKITLENNIFKIKFQIQTPIEVKMGDTQINF